MQNKHETNFENTKEQLNETLTENGASSKKKSKNYGDSQKKTAKYVISAIAVGNESVTEVPAAPIERKIQLGQGVFTPCNVIENNYTSSTILINGKFKIYAEPMSDAKINEFFSEPEIAVKSTEVADETSQAEEKKPVVALEEEQVEEVVKTEVVEKSEDGTETEEQSVQTAEPVEEQISEQESENGDNGDNAEEIEEKAIVDTDGVLLETEEEIEEIAAETNELETQEDQQEQDTSGKTEDEVKEEEVVQEQPEEQTADDVIDEISATEDTDTAEESVEQAAVGATDADTTEEIEQTKTEIEEVEEEEATSDESEQGEVDKDGAPVYEVNRDFEIKEEVSVSEATKLMSDEDAKMLVEEEVVPGDEAISTVYQYRNKAVKDIINIDVISANFKPGEYVNLETLKEHKLIGKKTTYVKVLARGYINKPLIVEADAFSIEAIKMIVLTGGRVIRKRSK